MASQFDNRIHKGMVVYSSEGDKLGKVTDIIGDTFIVEKGFFFPEERRFSLSSILSLNNEEITVTESRDALLGDVSSISEVGAAQAGLGADTASRGSGLGMGASMGSSAGTSVGTTVDSSFNSDIPTGATASTFDTASVNASIELGSEEIRVPLVEEEVVVDKYVREAGQVRVRKEVTTEIRQIEVPVTREEVIIERVATNRPADGEVANFDAEEIVVPVRVEEVEVTKRPVIREEVRIRKEAVQEERHMDTRVRKERADVEREGEVERLPPRKPGTENRPTV